MNKNKSLQLEKILLNAGYQWIYSETDDTLNFTKPRLLQLNKPENLGSRAKENLGFGIDETNILQETLPLPGKKEDDTFLE